MWHFVIVGGAWGTDNIISKSTPSRAAPFPSSGSLVFKIYYGSKSSKRINQWETKNKEDQLYVTWWEQVVHANIVKVYLFI